jgi:xylulokinase
MAAKRRYVIGVDLGTSATRAGIFDLDGRLLAEASRPVPIVYPAPGQAEQEMDDFLATAAQAVAECLQRSGMDPREVAAIAFDSQMAGVGGIDERYQPVMRFDSWLDMRCEPYIRWLERSTGEDLVQITGCAATCDHAPKMLWWKHEQPEVYDRVARFVMPSAYVAGRLAGLAGEDAYIDYTFLHFTGLADVQQAEWADRLLQATGLDRKKLPRIVEPFAVIGEATPGMAGRFGLAPGTLVAAGCGDTAACALGAGIVRPGMLYDTAGTASVLAACVDRFAPDPVHRALLMMRSVVPGIWHPLAYIAGGGEALRWFRDQFFNTSRGQALPPDERLYDLMAEQAAAVPSGSEGLFFSPHLGGRVCPAAPQMRGAWIGFSWKHTQAHFFRAILESVAYEYAYYLAIIRLLFPGMGFLEARAVGGGARSRLWNEIKAAVLGVPYRRLRRDELGIWGSALVAAKAAGLVGDLAETAYALSWPEEALIVPRAADHERYQPCVRQYIRWQTVLASEMRYPA